MRISRKICLGIGGRGTPVSLLGPEGVAPRAVKLIDPSPEYVREVREQVGQKALIVVRFYEGEQPLLSPESDAWAWFASHLGRMVAIQDAQDHGPIAFEGYNEVGREALKPYIEFEAARLGFMQGADLCSVVGNWSVGVPEPEDWALIAEGLLCKLGKLDYVGLHEYGGVLRHVTDPNSPLVGRFLHPDAWRYLRNYHILITEFGTDEFANSSFPPHERGVAGWKRLGITAREYASTWVQAFSDRYEAIEQVQAAFAYGVGNFGHDAFDLSDVWPWVTVAYDSAPLPSEIAMPENEEGNLAKLLEKAVWWSEELSRQLEAGNEQRAREIGYSLTKLLIRAYQAHDAASIPF